MRTPQNLLCACRGKRYSTANRTVSRVCTITALRFSWWTVCFYVIIIAYPPLAYEPAELCVCGRKGIFDAYSFANACSIGRRETTSLALFDAFRWRSVQRFDSVGMSLRHRTSEQRTANTRSVRIAMRVLLAIMIKRIQNTWASSMAKTEVFHRNDAFRPICAKQVYWENALRLNTRSPYCCGCTQPHFTLTLCVLYAKLTAWMCMWTRVTAGGTSADDSRRLLWGSQDAARRHYSLPQASVHW